MLTNELRSDLEELGFSPDEVDRLEEGYGEVVLQEAWMRLDMRELAGEIDEPQKYFLGICNGLRNEGYTGTGAARTEAKLDPYAEQKHVPQSERTRRIWQSKLMEAISDRMAQRSDNTPGSRDENYEILKAIDLRAVDEDTVVIHAPSLYHRSIYETFGPLCLGKQMDIVDEATGVGSTYHTESIRIKPTFTRAEIKEKLGLAT